MYFQHVLHCNIIYFPVFLLIANNYKRIIPVHTNSKCQCNLNIIHLIDLYFSVALISNRFFFTATVLTSLISEVIQLYV